jgi:hypothetical protein
MGALIAESREGRLGDTVIGYPYPLIVFKPGGTNGSERSLTPVA